MGDGRARTCSGELGLRRVPGSPAPLGNESLSQQKSCFQYVPKRPDLGFDVWVGRLLLPVPGSSEAPALCNRRLWLRRLEVNLLVDQGEALGGETGHWQFCFPVGT